MATVHKAPFPTEWTTNHPLPDEELFMNDPALEAEYHYHRKCDMDIEMDIEMDEWNEAMRADDLFHCHF